MSSLFANNYSYHATTKSFITAFGSIFDKLEIHKTDITGKKVQNYLVPLTHAPKNKWVSMINERPEYDTKQVQMTLPRMAFEIVSFSPNMTRKMGFNGTSALGNLTAGGTTKIFNPTPIDLTIKLYAITKDMDDMLQIIEQILPYFQPFLTLRFNLLPEFNIYKDIQLSLLNVQTSDSYQGGTEEMRTLESEFTFTAPMYFFGPIAGKGKVIKESIVNLTGDVLETFDTKVNPITAAKTETHTVIDKWTQP